MTTRPPHRPISAPIPAPRGIVRTTLRPLGTPGRGPPEMSLSPTPRLYYSTWLTDLYLVVIFYLNYFLLAPRLMRRRLFQPYLWVTLAAALIGFIIPILCYSLWDLTMPGVAEGTVPVSSLGVIGVVAAMAIGLSVRGLYEWDSLGQEVRALKEEKTKWDTERDELQRELTNLKASATTSEPREALPSGEETTDTL